jgi:hypothetical protein
MGLGVLYDELRHGSWWGLFGIPLFLLGLTFFWISSVILYRTTSRYIAQQRARKDGLESQVEHDEAEEQIECLECGEYFDAQADACPSCGWTYS